MGVSTPTLTRHEHAHHAPHCTSNRHSCTSKTKHDAQLRSTSKRDSAAGEDRTHAFFRAPASQHACRARLHGRRAPTAAAAATMSTNLSAKACRADQRAGAEGRAVGRRGGAHRDREVVGGAHADGEGRPPWIPAGGWGSVTEEVVPPPPALVLARRREQSKMLREARTGQQIVQKKLRETLSAHGMGSGARRDARRQAAHALASESCPSPGSLASRSQDQAGGHASSEGVKNVGFMQAMHRESSAQAGGLQRSPLGVLWPYLELATSDEHVTKSTSAASAKDVSDGDPAEEPQACRPGQPEGMHRARGRPSGQPWRP